MTVTEHPTVDARDPAIEAWLDELHVTYRYEPDLELDTIDVAKSRTNQARIGEALDEETVERYAGDYERGDTFPPLLVRRTSSKSKCVLLGGNHRDAGARQAGRTTHAAYVITCDPQAALRIMYEDNRRHGIPPSRQDRMEQAVHLINTTGCSQVNAASIVGLRVNDVSKAISEARGAERARDAKANSYFGLPQGHRVRLSTIPSDPVFAKAVQLVAATGMTQSECNDLVNRVKSAGSDRNATKLIKDELDARRTVAQRNASRGGGPAKATAYMTIDRLLREVEYLTPAEVARSVPDTADARKLLLRRMAKTSKLFGEVARRLDA